MLRRPLILLALVASLSPAAELEFSHELHLGRVGLECGVCHAGAGRSDTVSDHLLPAAETCLACHNGQFAPEVDVAPLEGREAAERAFFFSHQQHLQLDRNIAAVLAEAIDSGEYLGFVPDIRDQLGAAAETEGNCQGCHRGLETAAKVDSDVHLPSMADCLVCHDQIEAPFSCEECHAPSFDLKPASHGPGFHDFHSSGELEYDSRDCEVCHGRNFTCMGCH